jgi:Fe-S cluster biogenesis protein NfuA/nitrite reductase/ring-hydroxylating ferredoxin subunit
MTDPGELLERVEQLSARVEELADPEARELVRALVGAVVAMYGDGLERIVKTIEGARGFDPAHPTILDELSEDGAVASLLLIHDLYPVPLEQRVLDALDTVRPYMESHGGNVQLLGIEAGVARLALEGSCNGCAASRATLETAIKQALDEHAPDLTGLEVQGVTEPAAAPAPAPGAFELPMVHSGPGREPAPLPVLDAQPARWVPLDGRAEVGAEQIAAIRVEGVPLLLANVGGSLLAYRDACASCGAALHDGELLGQMLRCPSCQVEFDLPRAGRAAGGEPLQLAPVPLLQEGGVRVAV